MKDITLVADIEMDEGRANSSVQENVSFSQRRTVTHSLFGENSETPADNGELTVQFSETNRKSYHLTLSERLTPSLISAGLAKGTTLTFGRRLLNLGIRVGVSYAPDGTIAGERRGDSLF